jgi:hypothetical protein
MEVERRPMTLPIAISIEEGELTKMAHLTLSLIGKQAVRLVKNLSPPTHQAPILGGNNYKTTGTEGVRIGRRGLIQRRIKFSELPSRPRVWIVPHRAGLRVRMGISIAPRPPGISLQRKIAELPRCGRV